MTALAEIGSFNLLDVNVGLAASVALIDPLLAAFDLALYGEFGLGALQLDISLQFQAALSVQLNAQLSISDPRIGLALSLSLIGQLVAGLQAALTLDLPTINAQLSLDASASLAANLNLKLGGIGFLIKLALSVKIPVVNLIAELSASLSAGPVVLLSFGFPGNEVLSDVGGETAALFSGGLTGILPTDAVAGIMIVTKVPAAKIGLSALLKTS